MQQLAFQRLVLLLVLALTSALASSEALRQLDNFPFEGNRHRRSLLSATQQISQCDWIAGEGCAVHPAYASYALNRSSDDVVAQYVSNSLACASATDKGLCESASYCRWDPSFGNGQQGCFLHDDAVLALQLRCVQPQHHASLNKLQSCMAARHSCQCSSSTTSISGSSQASCSQRQQQLLASFGNSRDKVCSSLLGCWLSSLNSSSSSPDITQLVEAQLLIVQPRVESLGGGSSSSSGGGRRRALQQLPPGLSDPVLDDKSGSGSNGYSPESGSYGGGSSAGVAGTPSVGMNGGVTDDQAANPATTSTTPVENANNVAAPGQADSSSSSNTSAGLQLEAGSVGSDWVLEQATVDPDQVFGSSGSSPSGGSSDGGAVQMTGGNAPKSFWQCAADAAVKADTTRKWADIDYNSKTLTLTTWIKVIQPTSLVDWGVQVLECFKAEVPKLTSLDTSSNSTKPNKESLEFAIVTLIRAFTQQAEAFRAYLQAGSSSRSSSGLAALSKLSKEVLPSQLAALTLKQQSSAAYRRDVMLQAAAILTDMQWFAGDVLGLSVSAAESSAQQEAFEGFINYSEESMRRCLYWLFYLQFDGPPAHLPGPIPSSAASAAVVSAFDALAAAALPAPLVSADAAAWQQLQVMLATAAGSTAAAAAQFGELDATLILSNTIAGLAKAHVHDLWGSRLELARARAPDMSRQLALQDPSQQSARWQPLRSQQVAMLRALQERAVSGDVEVGASNLQLSKALRDLVAASGAYLLSSGNGSASQQQQRQVVLSDALGLSAQLALLIRQCYGSPVDLPALPAAVAAKAGVPSAAADACARLAEQTDKLAALGQSNAVTNTLKADLNRQWGCNAVPAVTCSSRPGCVLALAPVLVAEATASSGSNVTLSCQASDASLFLSSLDESLTAELATDSSCRPFLSLKPCEGKGSAAQCASSPTCRWEANGLRNLLHTAASSSGSAAAAAPAASAGICAMDWVAVLSSTGSGAAYSSLSNMVQLCGGIADAGQCQSQSMLITLDPPAPAGTSMARFWVPALAVAGVAGVLLFGAAIWWRRRTAAARRAAEEARTAAGGGRGGRKGGKDGKGGKGAKAIRKKPKRAEPGSYKPDLMRDSFTDYMRAAPQQFNNGVALAKAAMATGDLDTAVALTDVAGGRQVAAMQPPSGSSGSPGPVSPRPAAPRSERSWGLGVGATHNAAGSQSSTDLIDLSQSEASAHNGVQHLHGDQGHGSGTAHLLLPAQQQATGRMYPPMTAHTGAAGAVWGPAAAAAGGSLGLSQGLVSPRDVGQGYTTGSRGALQGDFSVPVNLLDANASIALTSSINLLSSLPQHSSVPVGLVAEHQLQQQQQQLHAGFVDAARANYGASNSLARVSANSLASSAYAGRPGSYEAPNPGSLLLPAAARAGPRSEEGSTTPTSSCCHDSVCTFGQGPASVASTNGSGGRHATAPGSTPPHPRLPTAATGPVPAASAQGLSAAPSMPLSRSSWSSAMSTDLLMRTQDSSTVLDA